MNLLSPPCPQCGRTIPFRKTQWKLGRPFECEGCKARLVIPQKSSIGISALLAYWLLKDRMHSTLETVLMISGLLVVVFVISRIFLTPRIV